MTTDRWQVRPESERDNIMERLYRKVNKLFSELGPRKAEQSGMFPPVNMSEDDEYLFIEAEMPGIGPEEFEISVGSDSLTIQGERKVDTGEGIHFQRRERQGGHFKRTLPLPFRIDPERTTASFKNGILRMQLHRAKETEPRQVKITAE